MLPYPLQFQPIFQERPWGGRRIAERFGKALPPGVPIGESWEISDRPDAVSVIASGALAGRDLRWLMCEQGPWLLGRPTQSDERFPWLIKILDAREDLSLQVHPPLEVARRLQGDPKDELWYWAESDPDAQLYAGLVPGVTRSEFERRTRDGTVAQCLHAESAQAGDAIYIPSGRVHALGGGNVVFEVQLNSDTTYRVFDWNRLGLDGKPRSLHLESSFESIDFTDFEPHVLPRTLSPHPVGAQRSLLRHPQFEITEMQLRSETRWNDSRTNRTLEAVGVVSGEITIHSAGVDFPLRSGDWTLFPAALGAIEWRATDPATVLRVTLPN